MKYSHSLEVTVDMLAYAIDNPAPSTIVLISGDRDFAYALSILRLRRYQVVLITLPTAHPSLTSQASVRFDWLNDILEVQKPSFGTNTHLERSRAASLREMSPEISRDSQLRPNAPSHTVGKVDFDGRNEESSYLLQCSPKKGQRKPALVSGISAPSGLESVLNTQTYVGVFSQNHQPPNSTDSYSHPVPQNAKLQSPLTNASINDVGLSVGTRDPPLSEEDDFISSTICAAENSSVKTQTDNGMLLFPKDFRTPLMSSASSPSLLPSPPITDDLASTSASEANHPLRPNSVSVDAAVLPSVTTAEQVHPDGGSTTISSGSATLVPAMFIALVDVLRAHRLKGDFRPRRSLVGGKLSKQVFKAAGVQKFSEYSALAAQKGIVQLGGMSGNAWIALTPPFHNISST